MRRVDIELIGGRFDGFQGAVPPECIAVGLVLMSECPDHGANKLCGCDDEMLYGYFAEPNKGAGQFVVVDAY